MAVVSEPIYAWTFYRQILYWGNQNIFFTLCCRCVADYHLLLKLLISLHSKKIFSISLLVLHFPFSRSYFYSRYIVSYTS